MIRDAVRLLLEVRREDAEREAEGKDMALEPRAIQPISIPLFVFG